MTEHTDPPAPRRLPLAAIALGIAILGALAVLFAGPGTRSGTWDFRTGFSLLRYGAFAAIAALLLAVVALAMKQPRRGLAIAALLLALPTFFFPWNLRRQARAFPGIHDITTDPQNPPSFVTLIGVREQSGATNTALHEGDSIARIQREAYPDIQPVMIAASPDSAFALAYHTAEQMGWEMVEADAAEGRIEATATTKWFGFKDDVVIRVRRASGISRVDVRSVSRVGRGDAGANAKRIREYLSRLPGKVEM